MTYKDDWTSLLLQSKVSWKVPTGKHCLHTSVFVLVFIISSKRTLAKVSILPVPKDASTSALYPYVYILAPGNSGGKKSLIQYAPSLWVQVSSGSPLRPWTAMISTGKLSIEGWSSVGICSSVRTPSFRAFFRAFLAFFSSFFLVSSCFDGSDSLLGWPWVSTSFSSTSGCNARLVSLDVRKVVRSSNGTDSWEDMFGLGLLPFRIEPIVRTNWKLDHEEEGLIFYRTKTILALNHSSHSR